MLNSLTIDGGPERLVFLHGLFGQGKNFLTIAKNVADLATSTLVDLPNHGRSPWTETISYPAMAESVAELLRTLDGPVSLVGHSMGGKVAMRVALDHPELVSRLMVVDISPRVGLGSNFDPFYDAMLGLDLAALESRAQADELLSAGIPNPVVRGFLMQNLRRDRHREPAWQWQMNLQLLHDSMDEVAGWPDTLGRSWTGPTYWVAGEMSNYVTDEATPTMRELFPRVQKLVIKGAGHWVHSEQPERFTLTLRHWLGLPA